MSADLLAAFGNNIPDSSRLRNTQQISQAQLAKDNVVDEEDDDDEEAFGDFQAVTTYGSQQGHNLTYSQNIGRGHAGQDVLFDAQSHELVTANSSSGQNSSRVGYSHLDITASLPTQQLQSSGIGGAAVTKDVEHILSRNTVPNPAVAVNTRSIHVAHQENTLVDPTPWTDFSPLTPSAQIASEPPVHLDTLHFPIPQFLTPMLALPTNAVALTPTNIPPPSLLISLFPSLIIQTSQDLLTPLLTASASTRQAMHNDSELRSFMQSYLALLHTLTHVMAARKLRWRRDKFLSQAMSIGHGGGMKLTGVDKSEAGREEQEISEIIRTYGKHVGNLKSIVGSINTAQGSGKLLQTVPELASAMPIKTVTAAEGGIISIRSCGLCGMKRDERVSRLDIGIQDSFGEWWIEGTNMHLDCWRFWEGFKSRLNQR